MEEKELIEKAVKKELVISRTFDFPKEKVFKAFSEASALSKWWGPKGSSITVVRLDFRPGGVFHYKTESMGQVMWGRFIYGEINPADLIEYTVSFSDDKGSVTRAPFNPFWPMEIFNSLTFTENNDKTTLIIKSSPLNPNVEEARVFSEGIASIKEGFEGSLDRLNEYLSRSV